MRNDSYNGASEKAAEYTDRLTFDGKTVFFDSLDEQKINDIASAAGVDWLQFVMGCNQYGYRVECLPSGAYNII